MIRICCERCGDIEMIQKCDVQSRKRGSTRRLLYKFHVVLLLLDAFLLSSIMAGVANTGSPRDLVRVSSIPLYCFAEGCMWFFHLALPTPTRPEAPLPRPPGAFEAHQLRRAIINLPHRSREVHVASEFLTNSTSLAIAIMALCDPLFQRPICAIEIPASL